MLHHTDRSSNLRPICYTIRTAGSNIPSICYTIQTAGINLRSVCYNIWSAYSEHLLQMLHHSDGLIRARERETRKGEEQTPTCLKF